ncbi:MAG: hypothetical protein FK733_11285 [Asgard group archaeon]|nr:hypothetical protein [Asgard group archaeon]
MTEINFKKELTTLDKIISEIPSSDMTQQIREICDIIMNEESPQMKNLNRAPKGPNKFLILEVPGFLKKEIGFITLERESEEDYVGIYWSFRLGKQDKPARKIKVHKIEGNSAKKVMYQFAKLVKFYRGE